MRNKIIFLIFISFSLVFGKEFNELVNDGINFLKIGEFKKSIDVFEEAKSVSPENPDIYYYLGQAYFRDGDTENAISNLQKAINLNSKKPSYYYTLAFVYISQNKYKEAMDNLNKVIEISPLSFYGKEAKKLKEEVENKQKEIEIAKKWEKMEIEEKKKKEEEVKKSEEKELSPTTMPPGMVGEEKKTEKIPVAVLVKRIKFATEDVRKKTSELLLHYSGSEISPFIKDIIETTENEPNQQIKINLMLVCGKVNSQDVIEYLLSILKDESQSYAIRIVALDSISHLKTEEVINALRDTLSEMVDRKNRERKEAKENIEITNKKIDELTARKIFLNSENQRLQARKSEIDQKLSFQPSMTGMGQSYPMAAPIERQQKEKPLTESEIKKLREESKNIENEIAKNNEELMRIGKDLQEQENKLRKYEELLAMRERKVEISSLGVSSISFQTTPSEQISPEIGMPQMGMPQFRTPSYTPSQQEVDEWKNEVIFAIKIMNTLADMRDTNSLRIIKKAWREFRVRGLRIYYYIALGKLGEFRGIEEMVERLKQNFPSSNLDEEVFIRKNIVEVLGEYLKENYDEEIDGLIQYLAEEGEYPEIKNMARKVSSSLKKTVETSKTEE